MTERAKDSSQVRAMLARVGRMQRSHERWLVVATEAQAPPPPLDLDGQMLQVLVELAMVSNGTTQSWNPAGGSQPATSRPGQGHPEGRPAGGSMPPQDFWARQYDLQETDDGRRAVIASAREDLKRLAGRYQRNTTGETPEEYRERMLEETEGWSPEDVERSAWRMSARLVRRHRVTAGRWPETGKLIEPAEQATSDDLKRRAIEMDEGGMSLRQIAMNLGKDKKQIQRYLGRAA